MLLEWRKELQLKQLQTSATNHTTDLVVLHGGYAAEVDTVHCKTAPAPLELEPGLICKVTRTAISHLRGTFADFMDCGCRKGEDQLLRARTR